MVGAQVVSLFPFSLGRNLLPDAHQLAPRVGGGWQICRSACHQALVRFFLHTLLDFPCAAAASIRSCLAHDRKTSGIAASCHRVRAGEFTR